MSIPTTQTHGYSDEALASARQFRLLMDAMAKPGSVMRLPDNQRSIGKLSAGMVMIARTLVDHETPVWLDHGLSQSEEMEYLRFYCGCPIVKDKNKAAFAFFLQAPKASELDGFAKGLPTYPDRSTTVIIQVSSIINGGSLGFSGPGVKSVNRVGLDPLPDCFWNWWQTNYNRFPLGLDLIFVSPDHIAALPRSVKVMEVA